MSSVAVSAPAAAEPEQQPPGSSPDSALAHPAAAAHPGLSEQSLSSKPMSADAQAPVSGPALGDGMPPAISSDPGAAHPSPRPQSNASIAPQAPGRSATALRSPGRAEHNLDQTPEYHELAGAVKRASPEVVRQVVRDLWEKCLLGSDYHLAFLVSNSYAALSRASSSTLDRAVRDFGEKLVQSSKHSILSHLKMADLDDMTDKILAKASNKFLDRAMARRLETIGARQLVNALARAERLGYDIQDIVEEKTHNGAEHVVPSLGPMMALTQSVQSQPPSSQLRHPHPGPPPVIRQPSAAQEPGAAPPGIVYCNECQRPCSGESALHYHIARRACDYTRLIDRIDKDICPHCGCLFVSSGGLIYHIKSKVCGDYPQATGQYVVAQLKSNPPRTAPALSATPPAPSGTPISSQHHTPGELVALAGGQTPPNRLTPVTQDPYGKLSPEMRRQFEAEMKMAEVKYGGMMQEALKLPQPQRDQELTKLKNSYNSKQSVTRKKYGVRLRERRSKQEIESERARLLSTPSGDSAPSSKKPRLDKGDSASRRLETRPASAAGGLRGGLAGSAGPAEHTDPMTLLTPAAPRSAAQLVRQSAMNGTPDDPMQIDDDSDEETDSNSDDADIPASLPARTF